MKDYLKETDKGIQITLATPAMIGGALLSAMTMREPSVGDLEVAQAGNENAATAELKLFANLLECGVEDVRALKLRNWTRVQEAYKVFTA